MYILWRKRENSVFEGPEKGVVTLPWRGVGGEGEKRERFIWRSLQVTVMGVLNSSLNRTSLETWPRAGSEDWICFTFSQCVSRQVTPPPSDGSSYFLREEEELRKCLLGTRSANYKSAHGSSSIVSRSPQGVTSTSPRVLVTFELENKRVSLRICNTFLILFHLLNRVPNPAALP